MEEDYDESDEQKADINEVMDYHSALMNNQVKVWKTKAGPLQDTGEKAWIENFKSALFEILRNKEHFY